MTGIDEAMLIALVDGELDEVNRRRVERAVADDPALAARLAEHRRLRAQLSAHYDPIAQEPPPQALRALLDRAEKVTPIARPKRWMAGWVMGGALAASLVLGLGIGRISGGASSPIGVKGGVMVAQGALSDALDRQLASAQDGAAVRMGLSFRRKGGGWCRTFDGAVAGVACRDGDDWRIEQALPGAAPTADYRQAASGDPRLMATVESLMAGKAADAEAERAAQAAGWR